MFSGKLSTTGLPEGVYKIEMKANKDIVTVDLESSQTKFALRGEFELAKRAEEKTLVFTDSKELAITTVYPDRLQDIKIGSSTLVLNKTYQQFSSKVETPTASSSVTEIEFVGGGLIIGGDRVFAFSEAAYFNPSIKKATGALDPSTEYVLAKYNSPVADQGWKTGWQSFDLKQAYREKGAYSFIISIPELSLDTQNYLEIDEIRISLQGKSLITKLREKFHNN
jgi:hypothetical protein